MSNGIVASGRSFDKILPSEELRQDVKLLPLTDRDNAPAIPKELTWRYGRYRGKGTRIIQYIGAAGEAPMESDESKIKEMTDPYTESARKDFNTATYSDPTLAPSLENRNNSFFENSYDLILELTNKIGIGGKPMDEATQEFTLSTLVPIYGPHLQRIIDWCLKKDIALLEKMKASHLGSIVQGRSVTLITPPLSALQISMLPDSLTTLSTDETKAPLIDTVRRKLVAVKLGIKGKKLALIDEMIYCVRKNWGLRSDAMFYGASAIEPVVLASKGYKRVINFDFPKAAVAGYMTKLLLKATTTGDAAVSELQLSEILNKLVDEGTDIIGINESAEITPVKSQVDTDVLDLLTRKYEELLMSAGGSTMTQLGRTGTMNRDTATIQEITHMKYVRTPDEYLIAGFYESQLLNPLLKHLMGIATDVEGNQSGELPVRVKILRRELVQKVEEQTTGENTQYSDQRTQDQSSQLADKKIKQKDVEHMSFGA